MDVVASRCVSQCGGQNKLKNDGRRLDRVELGAIERQTCQGTLSRRMESRSESLVEAATVNKPLMQMCHHVRGGSTQEAFSPPMRHGQGGGKETEQVAPQVSV